MSHFKIITGIFLLSTFCLYACASNSSTNVSTTTSSNINVMEQTESVQTITGDEAKKLMDSLDSFILLDVRTEEEYNEGHIPGAILIPDNTIEENAFTLLPDKETTIFVYCRSGRRSANAAEILSSMGYTSIYDFGGIIDWNYDVTKE